jgi:protein involved in ribonucleotide reduction
MAGDIIAAKCQVPYLYAFELMGTTEDVTRVREGWGRFWQRQSRMPA